MKHRLLFVSAGVIALLVVMSALGSQPTARADTSSMDWDVNMTDAAPTGSDKPGDPVLCPAVGGTPDNIIQAGECPEIVTSMWMDTKDATSNEPFFDLAPQVWKTGPPGTDLDGDGLKEPSSGVAQLSNLTIGTTVGQASFSALNNVVIGNLTANNVDDIAGDYDSTVTGQPVVCGNPNGSTFATTFNLWWADESNTNLVPNANTGQNSYAFGQDCSAPPAVGYAETNVDTNLAVGQAAANAQRAQAFRTSVSGPVGRVDLWLSKVGAPTDYLTVEIQTDSGGVPSGTAVTNGVSPVVLGGTVGSSYGWVAFQFAAPQPQLTASTQYHVVLKRSTAASGTNYYVWGADQSSPGYVDGAGSVYGGSWLATSPDTDHAFYVFVGDPYGIPDGVDCTPAGVLVTQAAIGFPVANYVGRAFGIARLPVGSPPITWFNTDFNYLIYNMVSVPEVQGYGAYLMLGYRAPAADPTAPGYSAIAQSIIQCAPCTYAPVRMFGITQDSDFTLPADGVIDLYTVPEAHFKVAGDSGPYGFNLMKSAAEDWDGDTIADAFDRCRIDPASGAVAGDTDKDGLTGLCETLTGTGIYTNGEGATPGPNANNPQDTDPAGWNIKPPWDSGQDVDGDGYLNTADNCPIVPDQDLGGTPAIDYQQDTDGDGVGDVCEIDLVGKLPGLQANAVNIPGNGQGYPGRQVGDMVQVASPGTLVDRDNVCSDPFTPSTAEATSDSGRWCAGFDAVGRPYGPTPSGISALGRVFADSNDDGTPDLLDHPASGPSGPDWPNIEWKDVDSDSDLDGHSDACEAFMGTDPLDASSVPGSPAIADTTPGVAPFTGDCDGDTTPDPSDSGSDPFTGLNSDADGDGCTRSQELPGAAAPRPGSTAAGDVSFQDSAWYDFFDVPIPANNDPLANGPRSKAVNLQDVVGVLKYVGTALNGPSNGKVDYDSDKNGDTVPDGVDYDRSPSPAPTPPKDAGPPSGAINLQDVVVVLGQVGLSCA